MIKNRQTKRKPKKLKKIILTSKYTLTKSNHKLNDLTKVNTNIDTNQLLFSESFQSEYFNLLQSIYYIESCKDIPEWYSHFYTLISNSCDISKSTTDIEYNYKCLLIWNSSVYLSLYFQIKFNEYCLAFFSRLCTYDDIKNLQTIYTFLFIDSFLVCIKTLSESHNHKFMIKSLSPSIISPSDKSEDKSKPYKHCFFNFLAMCEVIMNCEENEYETINLYFECIHTELVYILNELFSNYQIKNSDSKYEIKQNNI